MMAARRKEVLSAPLLTIGAPCALALIPADDETFESWPTGREIRNLE
jgi:hypothetical protein